MYVCVVEAPIPLWNKKIVYFLCCWQSRCNLMATICFMNFFLWKKWAMFLHKNIIWDFPYLLTLIWYSLCQNWWDIWGKLHHRQYINVESEESSCVYMTYKNIIWTLPWLWDFIWYHSLVRPWVENCVTQTIRQFIYRFIQVLQFHPNGCIPFVLLTLISVKEKWAI